MRTITISPAMNGLIVKVGCQTLVFENHDHFITALTNYLANPDGVEKEWLETYVAPKTTSGSYTPPTQYVPVPALDSRIPLSVYESAYACARDQMLKDTAAKSNREFVQARPLQSEVDIYPTAADGHDAFAYVQRAFKGYVPPPSACSEDDVPF